MNPIPLNQLPDLKGKKLFGVVWHWTGGTHQANSIDVQHYHWIVNGDGSIVPGVNPTRNFHPCPANYGAHTRNLNSGWLAISLSCLGGPGTNDSNQGQWPMTKAQADVMVAISAQLAEHYGIPVQRPSKADRRGFLSHAEVQDALGISQAGKWDFTVCYDPKVRGAKNVGDFFRRQVRERMIASPVGIMDDVAPRNELDGVHDDAPQPVMADATNNRQEQEPLSGFRKVLGWVTAGVTAIGSAIAAVGKWLMSLPPEVLIAIVVTLAIVGTIIFALIWLFPRPIVIEKEKP
jgi:hypothetical protein